MANEKKSPFTRPQQPNQPVLGPDADKWVAQANGPASTADQVASGPETEATKDTSQADETHETKEKELKRLTIDIPASLHKRVKTQCAARETTIAEVVRKYLEKTFPDPERAKK